ncbi:RagB/SusD family nutrient uptake outer membrane protein [Tamlana sp. 2_MG-2023]|uniref:RagB/SusD family nutrient uptake outer membrane protein n=1 Tax=unclassified Tamlana TaxID=2614803 RepID=UPI0026E32D1D|nr:MULTISPECIES: RagB/SusD family nutrient uptake outer membrane protein [unclassified Tamlana]MDO6761321.1 RagB/SusD family nutrient uptake outer membrane protein [Tamlana sp. 2_MG-2023]MDO6791804.1 RagB/SusD family nutrient uptake outer membrane protein [Tamlana sp. 1_MG-2023]
MKNKIKKYIILPVLGAFLLTGCNEESFLDQTNPNTITTETFWNTSNQFQTGLNTVYGALQFQNISGGGLVYEMIMGDIGGTESWYAPFTFRNLTYNDGTYYVTDKWNELYVGIFRANQVIENLKTTGATFEDGERESIEAQARFLRAFFYFQVAHTYGGAVIHTEVAINKEDFSKPFSSMDEVTSTIIIPDLEYAEANLPLSWSSDNLGRITEGAAKSMLGKVYLYDQKFTEAAKLFKEVIDSGVYSLVPDIMDNFTDENELNSESIFEVAYNADVNPGANGAIVDDNVNETGAEATTLARAFGQLNFGGYNTLLPSYSLHELYTSDEVDPSKSINDGNMHSQRLSATIAPLNGETDYYLLPIGERGGWAFGQSSYIKKHTNWYHWKQEDANSRSGINFRHIRLADVYLMYAEAVLESTGNVSEAVKYIDMVRERAAVITLEQYMADNGGAFPQLHISKQVHGTQPLVAPSKESVLTHIQRVERPLELAFEGHRWKDLVRWGIVKEVFDELRADEVWRINNQDILEISGDGIAPLFIKERIRPDFNLSSANYQSAAHDYFPIPVQEQQTNDQLNN